jgi:hypothetical protein
VAHVAARLHCSWDCSNSSMQEGGQTSLLTGLLLDFGVPAADPPAGCYVHCRFGNEFESEALPGALPQGQNNPRVG